VHILIISERDYVQTAYCVLALIDATLCYRCACEQVCVAAEKEYGLERALAAMKVLLQYYC
jgi:hypothetical protein